MVHRYVHRALIHDSKVAALTLRFCPEFITNSEPEETVDHYLHRMGCGTIRDEAVERLVIRANVNGSRRVSSLSVWMRHALADQLEKFAEELS